MTDDRMVGAVDIDGGSGVDGGDEPGTGKTDVVDRLDGEEHVPDSDARSGDNGTGFTDVVGDRQGF